ncbi:MAG TPA: hypothetical protein VGR63_06560 [Casimicrobiaceae bacterium]|nr:hypothetical protein [Casimicrobiaceae bacterium]
MCARVRPARWIAAAAFAAALAGCTTIAQQDALSTSQRYAHALNARDYDTMIALTDPEVLARSENGEELRRLFPQIFGSGSPHVTEHIRDISPGFSDSHGMHFFVSTSRDSQASDGKAMLMQNYYIVTSRDLGKTWTIVDLSCVDERWIRAIAPGWNGYPAPPPQSVKRYSVNTRLLPSP